MKKFLMFLALVLVMTASVDTFGEEAESEVFDNDSIWSF
jgi:hypothetical protein